MSWRGLHFSNPAYLSLKNGSLRIRPEQGETVDFALEDLSYLVLESPQVTLTSALLAACSEQGCLLITCDASHMPNGALLPFHACYRQAAVVESQLSLSLPRQKRLWQTIIQAKIRNQSACLRILGKHESHTRAVAMLEHKVKSGDSGNTEALAARLYWPAWETDFTRDQGGENRLNAMLNYGYALIRACLSRELAAQGFIPALGIHHANRQNAFNLADDVLEPWRPFLDAHVGRHARDTTGKEMLDTEDKRALCRVLHEPVFLNGEREILEAARLYVQGIKKWYAGDANAAIMPAFTV